jgi:hypothetical protein
VRDGPIQSGSLEVVKVSRVDPLTVVLAETIEEAVLVVGPWSNPVGDRRRHPHAM